jgi:hypothetical protein
MKRSFLIVFLLVGGIALILAGRKAMQSRSDREFREELESLPSASV